MKICPNHHDEYVVPLIFTFAFRYCEYWCPYCNHKTGMFGDTEETNETPELKARLDGYKRMTREYLDAVSSLTCSELEYPRGSGKYITPSELPVEIIEEFQTIRDSWEENQKVEDWLATQQGAQSADSESNPAVSNG